MSIFINPEDIKQRTTTSQDGKMMDQEHPSSQEASQLNTNNSTPGEAAGTGEKQARRKQREISQKWCKKQLDSRSFPHTNR